MSVSWSSTAVAGKPVDVFTPSGPPRFGVLYLHEVDGQSLRGHPTFTRLLGELGLVCLCPQTGLSWWVSRPCPVFDPVLTPEQHLLQNVLPLFQERWGLRPRSIGLLGFGMGGQGALRLAFRHPELFPVVAAIAPCVDYHELYGAGTPLDEMYDSKEQCRQDTALLWLPPVYPPPHIWYAIDPNDEWLRGADRLHEKMNALGVEHVADLTTEAGGHSWSYFERMAGPALRFLVERLERESRRLL